MSKRRHERFVRRLETEFSADGKNYRGISSDFSCSGLFIRTNHAFIPDTILDIVIHLPEGNTARLRGRVRRALKTPVVSLKNGMGVELIGKDPHYSKFMSAYTGECDERTASKVDPAQPAMEEVPKPAAADFQILTCPICNVKNKVSSSKMALGPKCGKCGHPLVQTA